MKVVDKDGSLLITKGREHVVAGHDRHEVGEEWSVLVDAVQLTAGQVAFDVGCD